jgi:putative oxidoreductase
MKGAAAWGIALLRMTVGVIYALHGYLGLMVLGPGEMAGYVVAMGFPASLAPALAWYGIGVHLVGGSLLTLGLWSRWTALAQIPVIASAVFLRHLAQGFFMHGIVLDRAGGQAIAGGYEYTLLLLVATVTLVLTGGGTLTLMAGRR